MSQPQLPQPSLSARVPAPVAPKLHRYVELLAHAAPGLATGCYLAGSLALDAFDAQRSDVDFVAFLSRPATAADVAALGRVHTEVERIEPHWKLEGSYLQWGDLGRLPPLVTPGPYCNGSGFGAAGVHDLNPVTWWLLQQGGIPLLGPPPQELPLAVKWAQVAVYVQDNLNRYWRAFTRPSRRLGWLLHDWGVEWAVLGVCRLWAALHVGAVLSKVAAGEAMLATGPARWRRIVQEGLALRRGEPGGYRWPVQRAGETMQLVRYVIERCGAPAA